MGSGIQMVERPSSLAEIGQIPPQSARVRKTRQRDGVIAPLEEAGSALLQSTACREAEAAPDLKARCRLRPLSLRPKAHNPEFGDAGELLRLIRNRPQD